jgi:hypothetical protein
MIVLTIIETIEASIQRKQSKVSPKSLNRQINPNEISMHPSPKQLKNNRR